MNQYHTRSGPSPWVLGFEGRTLPHPLAAAIRAQRVSGLMLFRDNLGDSVEEAWALREEILSHVPAGQPFLFFADEEGGLIHPTAGMISSQGTPWPAVPTPRAMGRIGKAQDVRFVGQVLGERLRHLGIHVDLAPSLDLDTEGKNGVIGSRSYGSDPERVATLGWGFVRGLHATRTNACLKHYPGHGGTEADSHKVLPTLPAAERPLHEKPFTDCLGRDTTDLPWLMTAHVDWGDGVPASLSRAVVGRLERRFPKHLVITDSLDMGAVSLQDGAAAEALIAHNDVLLVGRDWDSGLRSITSIEEAVSSEPSMLAAVVRSRSRIRESWTAIARRRRAAGADVATASEGAKATPEVLLERNERLAHLHRQSVRLDGKIATQPAGGWVWVLPETFAPHVDLRRFEAPSGKRRHCEECIWITPQDHEDGFASISERLASETRPILLGTVFRGRPSEAEREAWNTLLALPTLAVVAHLLDETWPSRDELDAAATAKTRPLVAFTGGPHTESLVGLAEALDLPDTKWEEHPDGTMGPKSV